MNDTSSFAWNVPCVAPLSIIDVVLRRGQAVLDAPMKQVDLGRSFSADQKMPVPSDHVR